MGEYFSHDYDSRDDEKVIKLMVKHGWAGYGLFWGILELLYKNDGLMRTQYDSIAFALRADESLVKEIVEGYDLFTVEKGNFFSESVIKRLKERESKSQKARESALSRWDKHRADANAVQTQSDGNAIKKRKDSKVKKEKIYRAFAHLSLTVNEFESIKATGYTQKRIDDILDSIENYKNNDKYKSLNLTVRAWLKRDKEKVVAVSNKQPKWEPTPLPDPAPMPESLREHISRIGK